MRWFARLPEPAGTVPLTTDAGDFAVVTEVELRDLREGKRARSDERHLSGWHARRFVVGDEGSPSDLVAAQIRTRKSFLRDGPMLHIFVARRDATTCPLCRPPGRARMPSVSICPRDDGSRGGSLVRSPQSEPDQLNSKAGTGAGIPIVRGLVEAIEAQRCAGGSEYHRQPGLDLCSL